jgi:hypothetical protein
MEKQIIRSQVTNKIVGEIIDGIFVKKVVKQKHLFRIFGGYGIDKSILQDLQNLGIKQVKIIEKDTQNILITDIETFLKKGTFLPDKGFGEQYVLNLAYFNTNNN